MSVQFLLLKSMFIQWTTSVLYTCISITVPCPYISFCIKCLLNELVLFICFFFWIIDYLILIAGRTDILILLSFFFFYSSMSLLFLEISHVKTYLNFFSVLFYTQKEMRNYMKQFGINLLLILSQKQSYKIHVSCEC